MIGAAVAAVGGAAFFLGGVRFAACAKDACIAACADEFWSDAVSDLYDAEKAFLSKTADERRKILAVDPSSGFAFCDLLWGEDEYFFLRNRLALYAGRNAVAEAFSKIESVEDGVECAICCDTFALTDSVPCEGDELHWFCKPCFRNYLTVTGTKGAGATQVKCPSCKALVGTDYVKGCLSAWELEDLEARAAERDAAVALRSDVAARLECVCGARGVVLKGDEPEDGIVQCPGLPGKPCERSYCIKCGAHAHPGKPCEDVDEDEDVLKALGSDTKRCPACGNGITKVGGCNHVLCAPPGGCGKSFCFICLQPHESHDPAKCRGGQQAHDLMMAHRPEQEAETMRRHAASQRTAPAIVSSATTCSSHCMLPKLHGSMPSVVLAAEVAVCSRLVQPARRGDSSGAATQRSALISGVEDRAALFAHLYRVWLPCKK